MLEYRNSHTTSTKCQYHAAHSKPVMCSFEFLRRLRRISEIIRKVDPIKTCNPWNPVAIKKVDPKLESAIVNGASLYSKAWSMVNRIPRVTVMVKDTTLACAFEVRIAWWHHVTETPDDNKIRVFRRGMFIGSNGMIAAGGHLWPNSTLGEILLWKNAQKNDKKNSTSDVINKIIPACRPVSTRALWFPCVKVSRATSRHHKYATVKVRVRANVR